MREVELRMIHDKAELTIYLMFQDWKRNSVYSNECFAPEYFLAWLTVAGRRNGFADKAIARRVYVNHRRNPMVSSALLERLIVEFEATIPKQLLPGWCTMDRKGGATIISARKDGDSAEVQNPEAANLFQKEQE